MIIAFAANSAVRVFRDVNDLNRHCDSTEVEDGVFTFLNASGHVLKPIFTTPSRREKVNGFTRIVAGTYTLVPSPETRSDLVEKLSKGELAIESAAGPLQSLQDLRRLAPALFRATET